MVFVRKSVAVVCRAILKAEGTREGRQARMRSSGGRDLERFRFGDGAVGHEHKRLVVACRCLRGAKNKTVRGSETRGLKDNVEAVSSRGRRLDQRASRGWAGKTTRLRRGCVDFWSTERERATESLHCRGCDLDLHLALALGPPRCSLAAA